MRATAVSIRADTPYVKAVNELARRKNKATADLVRETLDQALGVELAPLIIFFAQAGSEIHHPEANNTSEASHAKS